MTLPELRKALESKGVTPSRKLGQNFLHDANVAKWIADQLDPQPEDCVVEVGPGTGALSEHLAGRVRKLILIEYDQRLAEYLKERFKDEESVEVYHEDGARFDTRPLWAEGPVKMLGNLPYSAGGAILRNFIKAPTPVVRAVIMLQKEVIDRIIAVPRTKAFGVLTLRMQSEWDSKPIKTVGPECFFPRPLIDSTVMLCEPRKEALPVFDRRLFDELIRRGFAQRRKMLRKAMPEKGEKWEEVAKEIDCASTARAEELSLQQWVELTRLYDDNSKIPAQKDEEILDVVDESNEVIGQEQRSVIHEKELRHRAVHVLLVNGRSELLIQQRSRLKDQLPGKWGSSAAGHLDAGEDYETCARRELGEELGISAAECEILELKMVGEVEAGPENGFEFVRFYLGVYSGALRTRANEVEATLWIGQEDMRRWLESRPEDFAGSFRQAWQVLEERSG